jgi:hypothetical protein
MSSCQRCLLKWHVSFNEKWLDLFPWFPEFCTLKFSMISSAAHPRWPLRSPICIWFPSIRGQTPRWQVPPLIQDGWLAAIFDWFPSIIWQTPLHLLRIHDIPHHPTLQFHLISMLQHTSRGAYALSNLLIFRPTQNDNFGYGPNIL